MGFKEEYAKFEKPSQAREDFVYKSVTSLVTKDQILKSMKPITVPGPNGTKITYKVMPDYVSIEGMRVPMSGATAQRVANYFGLTLPSPQMTQEIYQNADVKVSARPLSGSGTTVGGTKYDPVEVVRKGVGYAPFAVNYNEVINKQLSQQGAKEGQIVSGFAKDITSAIPGKEENLGLYGFFDDKGKPIQGGNGRTPHDTTVHTEYGAFARLVSPEIEVTYPDGRVEKRPADSVYQIASYTAPKDTPRSGVDKVTKQPSTMIAKTETPKPSTSPSSTGKESTDPFTKVDDFLRQFQSTAHERRRNIIKRALHIRLKQK